MRGHGRARICNKLLTKKIATGPRRVAYGLPAGHYFLLPSLSLEGESSPEESVFLDIQLPLRALVEAAGGPMYCHEGIS